MRIATTDMTYVDSHPRHSAFLAIQLRSLAELITEQGNDLLASAGLRLPSRAVSSVLLIAERGQISVADIGRELNQPHQLVTQRVEILSRLGLIERRDDPSDGRRNILALTRKGKKELRLLEACLRNAEQAFLNLFEEIECDLNAVSLSALNALYSRSILDRIATTRESP